MKWFSILLFAVAAFPAEDDSRFFYSKSFPGSTPAYMQVTVSRLGEVVYQEAPDDELPLKFKLSEAESKDIFLLIDKLEGFSHPLESGLKVAFMGTKTFRLEKGVEKHEVQFNYSEDANARALWDWCEKITGSAQYRTGLDRAAKYDRLGVMKALTQLGAAIDEKRVVGLEQFLPTLDRIIKNENYMHTARARASAIAEFIRSGGQPAQQ
jgi:hypothetical protein